MYQGAWWSQAADGSWLRFDDARQEWHPAPPSVAPPAGLVAGPETPAAGYVEPPPAFSGLAAPAVVVTVLLALGMVVDLVSIVSGFFEYDLLDRIERGEAVADSELDADLVRVGLLSLAQVLGYLAAGIAFIVWFYRAHRNVSALGAQEVRHGSGWAIGAWFIPIFNLIRPKSMMNDVWRASDPQLPAPVGRERWRQVPLPGLFLLWWGAFVVSSLAYSVSRPLNGSDDAAVLKSGVLVYGLADLLSLVAAGCAIAVVRNVTARQEARRAALAGSVG